MESKDATTTTTNPRIIKGETIVITDSDDDDEDDDDYEDPIIDRKDVRITARRYLDQNDWKVKGDEVTELMVALTMGCGCNNGPIPTIPSSWQLAQDDYEDLYNMVRMARKRGTKEKTIFKQVFYCLEMRLHRPLFRLGLVQLIEAFL